MKIKNLTLAVSVLVTTFALQSCIKEKDLHQEKPITYSEINLQLGGDCITEEPMPMSRAAINDNKTIVGIAITMMSKQGEVAVSKPYAYGIFELNKAKNPENLKINVIEGYEYKVSCSMIVNAEDSIKNVNGTFAAPFDLERANNTSSVMGKVTNKFLTADQPDKLAFLFNIESSKIKTKSGSQDTYSRPFIERYHGVIEKLNTASATNVLKVYRRYFGVTFKQTGLKEGRLRIQLEDAPAIYLNAHSDGKKTVESGMDMVCMKNLIGSNLVNSENIKLDVFLEKTPGEAAKKIITTSILFKRNYKHSIAITDIDNVGTAGNVGFEVEDEEMTEDYQQDLPWQGDNF